MKRHTGGFTLIELMVVAAIVAIIAAIAIPSLLTSKTAANETSAIGTLRLINALEAVWKSGDLDRNSISDYWTGDLSGMYRVESGAGAGIGVAMIDAAVAEADDDKVGGGAATAGAVVPATGIAAANLIPLPRVNAKSGYLFRSMLAVRQDPDGNGQAWTSLSTYAFQARPEEYPGSGYGTMIVNEAGVIYIRDFGDNLPANADTWPAASPAAAGWRIVQ